MAPVTSPTKTKPTLRPRVLVVDDEPGLVDLVRDVVGREMNCRMISAANVAEAREIVATQKIELLVADIHLPDGDGLSLLNTLRQHQPLASAIIITGDPSVDGAITALRQGATDFVPKPFTATHLVDRVRKALDRQKAVVRQEQKLDRLKDAVKRLNEARKVVTKKVDLLCNDLVTAYGELSKQLDIVRTQEGYRKYIAKAGDLEQLLCHTMDWMLRQLGYANVGIWLASDDNDFQLGAYMKYTLAGEPGLTGAMKSGIVAKALKETFVHLTPEQANTMLSPQELTYLAGHAVMAVNCTYLGDPLAAVVLFRDGKQPFSEDDVNMLKAVSPLFAVALASVVRDSESDPDDASAGTEPDAHPDADSADDSEDDAPPQKRKRRDDPADWWKRGDQPPF